MRKILPLAGIGCVAILVLALIIGGSVMIGIGVNGLIKKKNDSRKSWVLPETRWAALHHRSAA